MRYVAGYASYVLRCAVLTWQAPAHPRLHLPPCGSMRSWPCCSPLPRMQAHVRRCLAPPPHRWTHGVATHAMLCVQAYTDIRLLSLFNADNTNGLPYVQSPSASQNITIWVSSGANHTAGTKVAERLQVGSKMLICSSWSPARKLPYNCHITGIYSCPHATCTAGSVAFWLHRWWPGMRRWCGSTATSVPCSTSPLYATTRYQLPLRQIRRALHSRSCAFGAMVSDPLACARARWSRTRRRAGCVACAFHTMPAVPPRAIGLPTWCPRRVVPDLGMGSCSA